MGARPLERFSAPALRRCRLAAMNIRRGQTVVAAALMFCAISSRSVAEAPTPDFENSLRLLLESRLGTLSAEAAPLFVQGSLFGCTIDYAVLATDGVYRGGGYMFVSGSLGFVVGQRGVAVTLKVVVRDIDLSTGQLTLGNVRAAYLVGADYQTTEGTRILNSPSDVPGSLFSMFALDPAFDIVTGGLAADNITIAFTREGGDTGVLVTVEPSVESTSRDGRRTRSSRTTEAFLDCSKRLVESDMPR